MTVSMDLAARVASLLDDATADLVAGRPRRAGARYRRALALVPETPDALHLLGMAEGALGRAAAGVRLMAGAVTIEPRLSAAWHNLANAMSRGRRLPAALSCFRRALALDPGNAMVVRNRARAALDLERPAEARKLASRADGLAPGHAATQQVLARAAAACRDGAGAERAAVRAVALSPGDGWAHRDLAVLRLGMEEASASRAGLGVARVLLGDAPAVLIPLGLSLDRLGEGDAAVDCLVAALAATPADAGGWINLAAARLSTRAPSRSQVAARRAIALDPGVPEAWIGLSAAAFASATVPVAERATRAALGLRPVRTTPAARRETGRLLVLKTAEGDVFRRLPGRIISFGTGNNAVDHVDRDRWTTVAAFVDAGITIDDLPPVDVVYSEISDPEATPRSVALASRLATALAERRGLPVINHPDGVVATTRPSIAALFADRPGYRTAAVRHLSFGGGDIAAMVAEAGLKGPWVVRRPGTHTGESLALCEDAAALRDWHRTEGTPAELIVAQFQPYADAAGWYRKMRVFLVDGVAYPVHLFLSRHWDVRGYADVRAAMRADPALWNAKRRFLEDPAGYLGAEAWSRLEALADLIPLDYFGVDFAVLPDGSILVFEANAAMTHHFAFIEDFPFSLEPLRAVTRAINEMIAARLGSAATL